jgi:hypothetical protein
MKILAIEKDNPEIDSTKFEPHLREEAIRVWELYQTGVIRELYFRQDWPGALLILESEDAAQANETLSSLPLVKEGLISFELIPLLPYPGFARLFTHET